MERIILWWPNIKTSSASSRPSEAPLHQLIELVLWFWPRWLSHRPNEFQLGPCVCIKSSSGKVAVKSNHLVRPCCQGCVRWWWMRQILENLGQGYDVSAKHGFVSFVIFNLMLLPFFALSKKNKWNTVYLYSIMQLIYFKKNMCQLNRTTIWWTSSRNLGPVQHKIQTKKRKDLLGPLNLHVWPLQVNDNCNVSGPILQPCHKCSYRQEGVILLQAAWQKRWQPTLGFHVCLGRRLASKCVLSQASSACHIQKIPV